MSPFPLCTVLSKNLLECFVDDGASKRKHLVYALCSRDSTGGKFEGLFALFLASYLVPTGQMDDPVSGIEIDSKVLGFFVFAWPSFRISARLGLCWQW